MNARMIKSEILKLVKRRGLMAWVLLLTSGALAIVFAALAIRHGSNPVKYGPAGGIKNFQNAGFFLASIGTAAAVLLGTMAGAGDLGAGVFRDLVVTGRSRLALFGVRAVGAVAVFLPVMLLALAVLAIASTALAGGLATPSAHLILTGSAWILLTTVTMLVVSVGVSSLLGSRASSITVLLAWQLLVSQLLLQISFLGAGRDAVLLASTGHFAPAGMLGNASYVTGSAAVAVVVVLGWIAVSLGAGAWRTRRMDA
jgi:hypothetical protein